jgi:hypothetical protein
MDKAVYIGAGTDILPVLLFKDIKQFLYIDSCPNSSSGHHYSNDNLIHKSFINDLYDIMMLNNFKQLTNNINDIKDKYKCIEYEHTITGQIVKYYINTPFSKKITLPKNIIDDIKQCNTIIDIGHNPSNKILEYVKKPTYFIGSNTTCYNLSDTTEDSICIDLYRNKNIISKYYYLYLSKDLYKIHWKILDFSKYIQDEYIIGEVSGLDEMEYYRKI